MHQRHLVIQEHNAEKAGLHWDLRIESRGELETYDAKRPWTNEPRGEGEDKVLMSFAIPKARLPKKGEFLLAVQTEDHPWKYKDFEGRIEEGYGKGDMKLLVSSKCDFMSFKEDSISFKVMGSIYIMFKPKNNKKWSSKHWLLKQLIKRK